MTAPKTNGGDGGGDGCGGSAGGKGGRGGGCGRDLAARWLRENILNIFERFRAFWSFLSTFDNFWTFSDIFGRLELFLLEELSLSSIHYVPIGLNMLQLVSKSPK